MNCLLLFILCYTWIQNTWLVIIKLKKFSTENFWISVGITWCTYVTKPIVIEIPPPNAGFSTPPLNFVDLGYSLQDRSLPRVWGCLKGLSHTLHALHSLLSFFTSFTLSRETPQKETGASAHHSDCSILIHNTHSLSLFHFVLDSTCQTGDDSHSPRSHRHLLPHPLIPTFQYHPKARRSGKIRFALVNCNVYRLYSILTRHQRPLRHGDS